MAARTIEGHAGSLHARVWEKDAPDHMVVIAHGYGEHIGRYEHVAEALRDRGASVYGIDHVGHGRSEGERALITDFDLVVGDLHRLVSDIRAQHEERPVFLLGHSMGGLIATRYAQRHGEELAGLVLSAPLVGDPGTGALLALEPLPDIPIDPEVLSRDELVQQAYMDDPFVYHGAFKRATLAAMAAGLLHAALDAPQVRGPVLWQHGEADKLVPLSGSRRLMELLVNADVRARFYPGSRHEIFNETNRTEVLADTIRFIEEVVHSQIQ